MMRRRITNYELRIANCQPRASCARSKDSSFAIRHSSFAKRGFTLIELIVVIAIISILLALVLPGAASMWSQRNEAGTINLVRGLLESARAIARRNGTGGLFFFVDPVDNVQRIAFIEAEPPNKPDAGNWVWDQVFCKQLHANDPDCITQPMAVDRFRVSSDKIYTVPSPYRVAPKYAMELAGEIVTRHRESNSDYPLFQQRLGSDVFFKAGGEMRAPRQRNFFTVIFNRAGQIVPDRDVLIHDSDSPIDAAGGTSAIVTDGRGDKTRLHVTGVNDATMYYVQQEVMSTTSNAIDKERINPDTADDAALSHMICDIDGVVMNFPSVDGLVVYDNSVVEGLDGAGDGEVAGSVLADELINNGRPMYITQQTGDIIMGEKGQ